MTDLEAWRTDPRERLLAAIDRTWAYGELGATPEELVDGYAHHLAELQRALLRSKGPVWTGSINQVINHIDPEAQR